MQNKKISASAVFAAIGLLYTGAACPFDMGNMMNPSKWMGGDKDRDRYDDYGWPGYGGPGYGYGGYPGYGYGGYPGYGGYGYGGYPGYGGYGYGGYPGYGGYGYGGYPGYGGGSTVVVPGTTGAGSSEIEQLKDRIRQLEGEVR